LQGAGSSELLHALFGDLQTSGLVQLDGEPLRARAPGQAIESGVVLLPSDRALSVFQDLSVAANATLSSLRRFTRWLWVRRARERQAIAPVLGRLGLGDARATRLARELSGGNRQRLALSRCLLTRPRVLLLDEPTRGVDIAAKRDIYRFIRELAAEGAAVVWVASELPELVLLSHRILVLSRAKVARVFENTGATSAALLRAAMSAPPDAEQTSTGNT
jgi:ABC-type sugar transport system ATPase subunit